MNGFVSRSYASGKISEIARLVGEDGGGEVKAENVQKLMANLGAELVTMSNRSLAVAADEAVQIHGVYSKIPAVKAVRTMTGAGIKEAKDAVEDAAARGLRNNALRALAGLAYHNLRMAENATISRQLHIDVQHADVQGAVYTSYF